jgi:hypothetical protein
MAVKGEVDVPGVHLPLPAGFLETWSRTRPLTEAREALPFLRREDEVLGAAAMRAAPPTRASFVRTLVRRMAVNAWRIERTHTEIDADGVGTLIYEIEAEGALMYFGVHARPSTGEERPGRLRDDTFDFFGTLMDGPPDAEEVARQEADARARVWRGRTSARCFGWTFANRSVRLFDAVLDALADGRQPDAGKLDSSSGYIVRNAGFYGNGRHGTRAWLTIPDAHPLSYPYHVDLFCLYLWRLASFDVVDEAARKRSDRAATLAPETKRLLGVGNASGIGTVAALVRWPSSLSGYVLAREFPLAVARSKAGPVDTVRARRAVELLERLIRTYRVQPERRHGEFERPRDIAVALDRIVGMARELAESGTLAGEHPARPWLALADAASRTGSREAAELLNAVLIELYAEVADTVGDFLPALMRLRRSVAPEMSVGELQQHLRDRYGWALELDLSAPGARRHFWYRSEENGENRRGERELDPGVEKETFVDVAGAAQSLFQSLAASPADQSVGRFLLGAPEHTMMVSRVQMAAVLPYSEIRANVIDAAFHPCDAIRFFLSVLGIERVDPASVQWVRGVFFQGAPLPADLAAGVEPDWIFPPGPLTDTDRDDERQAA